MRIRSLLPLVLCLFCAAGCAAPRVIEDTRVPEITIDEFGAVSFNGARVERGRIAAAVRSAGFRREQEVNILVPDHPDRALMQSVAAELVRAGYTRTVFVKNRKATSALARPK